MLMTSPEVGMLHTVVAVAVVMLTADAVMADELEVCTGATWRKLSFTKKNVEQGYFYNFNSWSIDRVLTYVTDELVPKSAASIAFLAMTLLILVTFILWRSIRACCMCCCMKSKCAEKQATNDPREVLTGRFMLGLKILVGVMALICFILIFVGLGMMNQDLVEDAWVVVQSFEDFAVQVSTDLSNVLNGVRLVPGAIDSLAAAAAIASAAAARPGRLLSEGALPATATTAATAAIDAAGPDRRLQQAVFQLGSDVKASAQEVVNAFGDSVNTFNDKIVRRIRDVRKDFYNPSMDVDNYRVIAAIVLYCLYLLFLIVFVAFFFLHCPAMVAVAATLIIVLCIIYFILTTALSMGLIGVSDGCLHVEDTIMHETTGKYKPLIQYYLYGPATQDVAAVLKQADIVDVNKVLNDVAQQTVQLIAQVPPALSSSPAVAAATAELNRLSANLTEGVRVLLADTGYTKANAVYMSTKTYVCCDFPNTFAHMWNALTGLGWMGMFLVTAAAVLLYRLDKLKESGYCCSCACMLPSRVNRVAPDDVLEDGNPAKSGTFPIAAPSGPSFAGQFPGGQQPAQASGDGQYSAPVPMEAPQYSQDPSAQPPPAPQQQV